MKSKFFHIPKKYLLLTAGIVWFAAGFNIIRIGILASGSSWSILAVLSAILVFGVFYGFIFRRLIGKHTKRILRSKEERMHILRFFDLKSYCIMAFMMTFGILLRRADIWPGHCIRMFYTGLGASLVAAGIGFCIKFGTVEKLMDDMREKSHVF